MCAELESLALSFTGDTTPVQFLLNVAEEIWLDEDERPDYEDLARTMGKIAQRARENLPLLWCDLHGWLEPYGYGQCAECPCRLPTYFAAPSLDVGGRPRRYCSNVCRQRAYRHRLKDCRGALLRLRLDRPAGRHQRVVLADIRQRAILPCSELAAALAESGHVLVDRGPRNI